MNLGARRRWDPLRDGCDFAGFNIDAVPGNNTTKESTAKTRPRTAQPADGCSSVTSRHALVWLPYGGTTVIDLPVDGPDADRQLQTDND